MSDPLLERIRVAQVRAGEEVVMQDLRDRGLADPEPESVTVDRQQLIDLLRAAHSACQAFNRAGMAAPGGLALAAERVRNSIGLTSQDLAG